MQGSGWASHTTNSFCCVGSDIWVRGTMWNLKTRRCQQPQSPEGGRRHAKAFSFLLLHLQLDKWRKEDCVFSSFSSATSLWPTAARLSWPHCHFLSVGSCPMLAEGERAIVLPPWLRESWGLAPRRVTALHSHSPSNGNVSMVSHPGMLFSPFHSCPQLDKPARKVLQPFSCP